MEAGLQVIRSCANLLCLKLSCRFASSCSVRDWLHMTGYVGLTNTGLHSLLWGAPLPVTLLFKLHTCSKRGCAKL